MFLRVISQNQDNLDATRVLIERIQHSSLNKLWRAHPFPFDVRSVPTFTQFLADNNPIVRERTCKILSCDKELALSCPIINLLPNGEPSFVRAAAIEVLGKFNPPGSGPALIKVLSTAREPGIRQAAAEALGQIEDPTSIEALRKAAKDRKRKVRAEAEKALRLIDGKNSAKGASA